MEWMSHRKRRETKQQPSMLPGLAVPGCCLVSICFLCDIHSIHAVHSAFKVSPRCVKTATQNVPYMRRAVRQNKTCNSFHTPTLSYQSWYFVNIFWNVPLAVGLIQHLLCSPIGDRNFRKKTKQNITTARTPHSVHWTPPPLHWFPSYNNDSSCSRFRNHSLVSFPSSVAASSSSSYFPFCPTTTKTTKKKLTSMLRSWKCSSSVPYCCRSWVDCCINFTLLIKVQICWPRARVYHWLTAAECGVTYHIFVKLSLDFYQSWFFRQLGIRDF